MKKFYFFCLFCLLAGFALAQSGAVSLFVPKQQFQRSVDRAVKSYSAFNIDYNALAGLYQTKPEALKLQIPFEGKLMTLDLKQTRITSDKFSVITSDDKDHATRSRKVDVQPGVFYAGVIEGHTKSIASIAIFNNQVIGVISDEQGNINLGALEDAGNPTNEYILYREDALKTKNPFTCATSEEPVDGPVKNQPGLAQRNNAVGQPIEIYFECDFALYQSKASSIPNVINYVLGFFNNTALLYAAENVKVQVSQIKVWTSVDPYVSLSTTGAILPVFSTNMVTTNYVGDFAHFLTTRNVGGGIAYLLNNPCSAGKDNTNAVSGISTTYSAVPTYSWTVEVVTHEMGHNLGSNHTQWCGWTGGALDNCYTTEGGCSPGPQPSNGGTIMSYCHLTSTGINLANGFGTQPGNKIRSVITAATCYGKCKMTIDITGNNIGCGNVTGSASVTATDGIGGYTYLWSNGQTTSTITGLATGTYYVTVKDNTGCQVINNITITSQSSVTPAINAAGTTSVCEGGTVQLSTPTNASYLSYQWFKGTSAISGANQPAFTATETGTYYVRVTTSTCAGQSSPINVTVTPKPVIVITPANSTVKKFTVQPLFASGADTYNWSAQPYYSYPISANAAAFTPLQTTTYTVTGTTTAGGCTGTGQATITVVGCGEVTDTAVTVNGSSNVSLKWKNPQDVTSDSVYYRIAGSTGAWTGILVQGQSVELTGLAANTEYEFYITPLCSTSATFSPSLGGKFTTLPIAEEVSIKVYPNPLQASSKIELTLKDPSKVSMHIVNALGQRIAVLTDNVDLPRGQTTFPAKFTHLSKGTYFIAVTINGHKYLKPILQAN